MHSSLQFSDTTEHKRHDVKKILGRARMHRTTWVTGTEAGPRSKDTRAYLKEYGSQYDYRVSIYADTWVAIDKRVIVPDSYRAGAERVLSASAGSGTHAERGIGWARFTHQELDRQITVGCAHYLKDGARKGQPNYSENLRLTKAIGSWGHKAGMGKSLVFIGADTNALDNLTDVFMGSPFTTLSDELKKYPGTGPGGGAIDVIASYDLDKRVKGTEWRVLSDQTFYLYSDHLTCEGAFRLRPIQAS